MKLNEPWKQKLGRLKLCKQVQLPPTTFQVKGVSEPTTTTPLDSLGGGGGVKGKKKKTLLLL